MKNAENVKSAIYVQINHEIRSIFVREGVILLSSPEAYATLETISIKNPLKDISSGLKKSGASNKHMSHDFFTKSLSKSNKPSSCRKR